MTGNICLQCVWIGIHIRIVFSSVLGIDTIGKKLLVHLYTEEVFSKRTSSYPKGRDKVIIGEGCFFSLEGECRVYLNHCSNSQKEWSNENQ